MHNNFGKDFIKYIFDEIFKVVVYDGWEEGAGGEGAIWRLKKRLNLIANVTTFQVRRFFFLSKKRQKSLLSGPGNALPNWDFFKAHFYSFESKCHQKLGLIRRRDGRSVLFAAVTLPKTHPFIHWYSFLPFLCGRNISKKFFLIIIWKK